MVATRERQTCLRLCASWVPRCTAWKVTSPIRGIVEPPHVKILTNRRSDFSAHSNYTELALIEMGERGVFPFVGRQTQMRLPGAQYLVYPVVTGTFGGVDFLHSVMGEFDDKATQSEIQQLEDSMSTQS